MKRKFIIAADVTLRRSMDIAPGEDKYDPATRTLHRHDVPAGIECTLTRSVRLLDSEVQQPAPAAGRVSFPQVRTIPAASIIAKLRSSAAELLFDALTKREYAIDPPHYYDLAAATAAGALTAATATVEGPTARPENWLLHYFDDTPFAFNSNVVVHEGWPLLQITKHRLISAPMLPLSPMNGDCIPANAPLHEGFNAVEAVGRGIAFALRLEVIASSPQDLGFVLLAFQTLLRDGQLGEKSSPEHRQFVCETGASRLISVDAGIQSVAQSSLFEEETTGYRLPSSGLAGEAVSEALDYVAGCKSVLLEAFAALDPRAPS